MKLCSLLLSSDGGQARIFVARPWVPHRMGSLGEKSLRYCAAGRGHDVRSGDPMIEADNRHMEPWSVLYEVSRWRS
ncbi:MAG: hypothetical protein JSW37_00615 [Anaerolineales bacterium]|nr:MAG: hypothetical protein JSW37_00615 [Anaerolineales bacterium]